MLRMNWMSAAAAAKYFDNHLEQDNYHLDDLAGEIGTWHGKGAELLGLSGEVKGEDFKKLAYNRMLDGEEKLTPRDVPGHPRAVMDMTFSLPKCWSLVAMIGHKQEIEEAFRDAVSYTMKQIEKEAKSRVRDHGANHDVVTGNLIWAEFLHRSARPVDGKSDPMLHIHAVAANATYREDKGRFMALQAGDLKRDAPWFEAVMFDRFATNAKALGYQVEPGVKGPVISGFPRELEETFSRRTAQVNEVIEKLDIRDPKIKALLGAKTRESKSSNTLSWEEQQKEWRHRLSPSELNRIEAAKWYSQVESPKKLSPEQAMDFAMEHAFERKSVVPHRHLLADGFKRSVGFVKLSELEEVSPSHLISKVVDGQKLCTTGDILASELDMLKLVRNGKHCVEPLAPDYKDFQHDFLNDEQKGAIRHVLSSNDRVTLVSGRAGVGKTTLMQEIQHAAKAKGKEVYAYAPTAQASRVVLRESGFENATTVASLLHAKDHRFLNGQIILIDEVGLLNVADAKGVFELAHKHNAHVVLSGDRRQHEAVVGSPAMTVLEKSKLIQPYHVSEVVRQQGLYKLAIQDIARGRYEDAINAFERSGWIEEGDDLKLYASIAKDYVKTHHFKEPNLVVVPTHNEADIVTAFIRKSLSARGQLGKFEKTYYTLKELKYSKAEKHLPASYKMSDKLVFNESVGDFEKGQEVMVLNVTPTHLTVTENNKGFALLPYSQTKQANVYRPDQLKVSKGDVLMLTKGGVDKNGFGFNNGDRVKVKSFGKGGDIVLTNGKIIPRDYAHLKHGYSHTSFAAQGKSVPVVQVLMNDAVKGAINNAQFYVSASRGKLRAKIYTNNIENFKAQVYKPSEKAVALDMVGYSSKAAESLRLSHEQRRAIYFMQNRTQLQRTYTTGTKLLRPMQGNATYKDWQLTSPRYGTYKTNKAKPIDWQPTEKTPKLKRPRYRGLGGLDKGRNERER